MKGLRGSIAALTLVAAAMAADLALAQSLSGRNIRMVVPFPPGGTADVIARLLGEQAGQASGATFVIENRPGAGTIIATELVARAPADGNTLLMMANSFVINSSVRASLPYDPLTSFEPICLLVNSPQLVAVNSASTFRTLADLVTAAKARPGELSYAAVGPATTQQIAFEMFKRAAGIDLTFVPYTGGAPAVNALLGGHVTTVLANYSELVQQVRGGKLRALAVTTRERLDSLPDVPTVIESGYPDYEASAWFGVVAPAKVPKETLDALGDQLVTAMQAPEVKSKLLSQGLYPVGTCGAAFGTHIRRQHELYARVIRDANIKGE
jgi:tripartite-type tricarboxylate transporter receptor subunit TctC